MAVLACRALAEPLGLTAACRRGPGAAAFAGHLYPVFLRFRGGKGVATFLGTLLVLAPLVGVATCLLWLGVAYLTPLFVGGLDGERAAAALALSRVGGPPGVLAAVGVMSVFLIWRHRSNIGKLLKGTESKIGQRPADGAAAAAAPVAPALEEKS